MRVDATGRTIPEIDEQLPDSGIVAPGDELLTNGRTVREMRRLIDRGYARRREVLARTAERLFRRLRAEG